MSKKKHKTIDNSLKWDFSNTIVKSTRFNDIIDAFKFLEFDAYDTYRALKSKQYSVLSNEFKNLSKNDFIENTQAAVATINMFYDTALDMVREHLEKWEKQKEIFKEIKFDV